MIAMQGKKVISEFLRSEDATSDDDTPFMDAGGLDSITMIELSNMLRSRLSVELPLVLLFDHPTVNSVVSFIESIADDPQHAGV